MFYVPLILLLASMWRHGIRLGYITMTAANQTFKIWVRISSPCMFPNFGIQDNQASVQTALGQILKLLQQQQPLLAHLHGQVGQLQGQVNQLQGHVNQLQGQVEELQNSWVRVPVCLSYADQMKVKHNFKTSSSLGLRMQFPQKTHL